MSSVTVSILPLMRSGRRHTHISLCVAPCMRGTTPHPHHPHHRRIHHLRRLHYPSYHRHPPRHRHRHGAKTAGVGRGYGIRGLGVGKPLSLASTRVITRAGAPTLGIITSPTTDAKTADRVHRTLPAHTAPTVATVALGPITPLQARPHRQRRARTHAGLIKSLI